MYAKRRSQVQLAKWTRMEKLMLFLLVSGTVLFLSVIAVLHLKVVKLSRTVKKSCKDDKVCTQPYCVQLAAHMLENMDPNVNPCEDFYEYSCGGWIKSHKIPEDQSRVEVLGILDEIVLSELHGLFEEEISSKDIDAIKKTKIFYQSCVNETAIAMRGKEVAYPLINELGGWPIINKSWKSDGHRLEHLLVSVAHLDTDVLVDCYVSEDPKDSSESMLTFDQPDLALPSRDYYLKARDDPTMMLYEKLIYDVAVLFGAESNNETAQAVKDIVDLEIKVANLTLPEEARLDLNKLYNRMTVKELNEKVPQLDWLKYLKLMYDDIDDDPILETEEIVVMTPEYLKNVFALVANTDYKTVVNYIVWRIMQQLVKNLEQRYREMDTELNRLVYGIKEYPPMWKVCVMFIRDNLKIVSGRIFIDRYFSSEEKENADKMVQYVVKSFEGILEKSDWMDEQTKQRAVSKAKKVVRNTGYPEDILNDTVVNEMYQNLIFEPDKFFENMLFLLAMKFVESFLRHRIPDRMIDMSPAVVNAYYTNTDNSINFPAAILQPPLFDKDYPMSINLGAIGLIIGHEITHGFDDTGSQYDEDGNLNNWWENVSQSKFKKKAQCFVSQYSKYQLAGDHVKGLQTLGENIADNGGVKAAYAALEKWLDEGKGEKLLPGLNFTHKQLFFVSVAQAWCGKYTKNGAKYYLVADVHSPNRFRILGSVSNNEHFAEQFKCPVGSPMNPKKECHLW